MTRLALLWFRGGPRDDSSWPAVARIDHILARGIAIREAKVITSGGSDHYAVLARVVR
jgi:endonuclease/exonuclease/phosphatase (EEP) superfamily protein YafD